MQNSLTLKNKLVQLLNRHPGLKQIRCCWSLFKSLSKIGWLKSVRLGAPVDEQNQPIPWITYPAISFLSKRLTRDLSLFEYGSGHSTLWWSRKVNTVTSCEHDEQWYLSLKNRMPKNVRYLFRPRGSEEERRSYCLAPHENKSKYDVIIIDGRDRVKCVEACLSCLTPEGVIVWDNSDRVRYEPGFRTLAEKSFKRLDFDGLFPGGASLGRTTLFYRAKNCFDL